MFKADNDAKKTLSHKTDNSRSRFCRGFSLPALIVTGFDLVGVQV